MKRLFLLVMIACLTSLLCAAGVIINRNVTSIMPITLNTLHYEVDVQNQVAAVTVTETFSNPHSYAIAPRYYFPLPSGASATQLRWFINGEWHTAVLQGVPQNPQGGPPVELGPFALYIGFFPLVLDIPGSLETEEDMTVEITYVQLLNYTFGNVNLLLKNNYTSIQTQPLQSFAMDVNINSEREIESVNCSYTQATTTNTGHVATVHYAAQNVPAIADCSIRFTIGSSADGFRFLSTIRDSIPDDYGHGFFTSLIEPLSDHPAVDSLPLCITMVIDHSGSMNYEQRLAQAQSAVSYIINHLVYAELFNIVAFDHEVQRLWSTPRHPTTAYVNEAVSWVNALSAVLPNGTNISGAMQLAIAQYNNANNAYHNVIMLITDGGPTAGITDTYQLINYVNHQVQITHIPNFSLFTFGVGSDMNTQLLNILAQDNNGTATFVGSTDVYLAITAFFNSIHNPLVQATTLSVTPAAALTEVYPSPLPDIYQDTQIVLVGRYQQPQPVTLQLNGTQNGAPVTFTGYAQLSEEVDTLYQFIPKLWASKKIDHLLVEYYNFAEGSPQAQALRQQIIDISLAYGVACVFTSFSGGTDAEDDNQTPPVQDVKLRGNLPNPFKQGTSISFAVMREMNAPAFVEIYNIKGQLIRNLAIRINGKGEYSVYWDGKDNHGKEAATGLYYYQIRMGKYLLTGKMTMYR